MMPINSKTPEEILTEWFNKYYLSAFTIEEILEGEFELTGVDLFKLVKFSIEEVNKPYRHKYGKLFDSEL